MQGWSEGTKDVGQPQGQTGGTAVCLKAGRRHVALIPTLGVAAWHRLFQIDEIHDNKREYFMSGITCSIRISMVGY